MEEALGLQYQADSDLYLINDTMHAKLVASKPTFTFKFGNTPYDTNNFTNIVLPYGAFDLKVGWPVYSTDQNYFPIRRATDSKQNTIGRALLQEAYLIVDHERRNFTIAPALFPDPLPQQSIITIHPNGTRIDTGGNGISTGAIAGIAVAAGVIVLGLVAAFFWWMRRRKHQRVKAAELADTQKRISAAQTDAKYGDLSQSGTLSGPVEIGAGRDHQISELAGGSAYAPDRKDRHSQLTELPSPMPVFEMEGDTHMRHLSTPGQEQGSITPRTPRTPNSPYSRGPSPYESSTR
jgi:hypothetical protein